VVAQTWPAPRGLCGPHLDLDQSLGFPHRGHPPISPGLAEEGFAFPLAWGAWAVSDAVFVSGLVIGWGPPLEPASCGRARANDGPENRCKSRRPSRPPPPRQPDLSPTSESGAVQYAPLVGRDGITQLVLRPRRKRPHPSRHAAPAPPPGNPLYDKRPKGPGRWL